MIKWVSSHLSSLFVSVQKIFQNQMMAVSIDLVKLYISADKCFGVENLHLVWRNLAECYACGEREHYKYHVCPCTLCRSTPNQVIILFIDQADPTLINVQEKLCQMIFRYLSNNTGYNNCFTFPLSSNSPVPKLEVKPILEMPQF